MEITPALTPKQAAFCREYTKDCNGTAAAKRAGYSERTANEQAARLHAKPQVSAEVQRLQNEAAATAQVTVASLLIEAEQARVLAREGGQPAAMVSATVLKAKLCGLLVDKHEDIVARDRLAAERERAGEIKKAAQLIAEAAHSLGLSNDASAIEIAEAMAENRGLMAPDAFSLLRATRMLDDANH
jgi:phage terminase small subunit